MTERSSLRTPVRPVLFFLGLAAVLLFGGCQAIFTYSPLSGLQQSPSDMTPAQRLTYAQDALASGDQSAMLKAYNAIKNDTGAQSQYITAQLGIELSGVPTVLRAIAADPTMTNTTNQLNNISAFIAANNLSPAYMVAAYVQFNAAQAAGATLTTMDIAMASMGLVLGDVPAAKNWDVTQANAGTGAAAQAYLLPAYNDPSLSGDLKTFIDNLYTYYGTLP